MATVVEFVMAAAIAVPSPFLLKSFISFRVHELRTFRIEVLEKTPHLDEAQRICCTVK